MSLFCFFFIHARLSAWKYMPQEIKNTIDIILWYKWRILLGKVLPGTGKSEILQKRSINRKPKITENNTEVPKPSQRVFFLFYLLFFLNIISYFWKLTVFPGNSLDDFFRIARNPEFFKNLKICLEVDLLMGNAQKKWVFEIRTGKSGKK